MKLIINRKWKFASSLVTFWVICSIKKSDLFANYGTINFLPTSLQTPVVINRPKEILPKFGYPIKNGKSLTLEVPDGTTSLFVINPASVASNEVTFDTNAQCVELEITVKGGWANNQYPVLSVIKTTLHDNDLNKNEVKANELSANENEIVELANKLCELDTLNFSASWAGDSRTANKAYRKSAKIKKDIIENNFEIIAPLTKYMLNGENLFMVYSGMVLALSLGVNLDLAKRMLSNMLNYRYNDTADGTLEKLGFEASMLHKSIIENRQIIIYDGQELFAKYEEDISSSLSFSLISRAK